MNTGCRVENHMLELAKKGQLLGGDMFGYRLKKAVDDMGNRMPNKNSLVQEPVEAYVVKTIFDLYTSDDKDIVKTSSSICRYLIENNMRTYKGDLRLDTIKGNQNSCKYQIHGVSVARKE